MRKLFIYGAGGHSKVVAEIAELVGYNDISFFEDYSDKGSLLGYPIATGIDEGEDCVMAIGNNEIRKKLVLSLNNRFIRLINPSANISRSSSIEEGTVVMAGVTINAQSRVGKHCIINTNSSIDHDCFLSDYVHLSPNVALAGNVTIGEGTHVGIGACIIQGVKIGKWCTIGGGTVVIRDVPDGATVVGNPGRVIKRKDSD